MDLKVGMYVRTEKGIYKINYFINNNYTQKFTYIDNKGVSNILEEKEIIKASHNIIDLIQSKDLIVDTKNNLYVVDRVDGDYVFTTSKNEYGLIITLVDYQMKSVVTKEQFESMSYKMVEKC